ncbi:hypothetical protein DICPUDRAFT_155374 [Dictyostelium purpureum]|uniref:Uncharacterized protein n=1 Tax=Dictyostelium purpureum TaxID=5786 RepID=F0ZTU1_DICPU|nr:uncharacterized protein DICPUDRAFT_155374 [Dictyostelium purpureum]EGC32620.1 hypothetical protein DICPUDRAFT_155374 [Dictyostelium purpureum]|eukprot:XP_003290835.1 hypothetical protein DICPUDRAFT_155374 [Dictyostelium purpureum]
MFKVSNLTLRSKFEKKVHDNLQLYQNQKPDSLFPLMVITIHSEPYSSSINTLYNHQQSHIPAV